MGKSRREIQKAYRERLKEKLGEKYNEKERERVRRNYVPSALLSDKERRNRNEQNKLRNRLCRERQKERLRGLAMHETSEDETSGYASYRMEASEESGSSSTAQRLIVNLPAVKKATKRQGAKKARARALARAHKAIKELKEDQLKLQKRLKSKTKQIERLSKKVKQSKNKPDLCTPERKAEEDMSTMNLTPPSRDKVKKKLLTSHVIMSEIAAAKKDSSKKRSTMLHKVVSGKVAKKYRCLTAISSRIGLCRRSLGKSADKNLISWKEQRNSVANKMRHKVIEFLSREDNSRTQSGKADSKKDNGSRKQVKVLTDYMNNLYQKFCEENPSLKISFATFCRLRPKSVSLARFISRNACQCLRHQNMALKIQALRKVGAKLRENPENILDHKDYLEPLFECIADDTVTFKTWKRVEIEEKRMKLKLVEVKLTKEAFIETVRKEVNEFSGHVNRLRSQFQQLKANKETLQEHHMLVQMDFAENYSCRYVDEPTCAYWKQTAVTLHPVVVYFKRGEKLEHKSFEVVSDELGHTASTVCTFLDVVIPELQKIDPLLQKIHYWTDSPSSQYRNRYIFQILAKHKEIYGCEAQWNYFEAGHGKSACDGIGGLTKRMADEAVRQGNATIQDAQDFYKWGLQSSIKEVSFLFVSKENCKLKQEEFSSADPQKVKNTMKLHAIAVQNGRMKTRETSCYCDHCMSGNFCASWISVIETQKTKDSKVGAQNNKKSNQRKKTDKLYVAKLGNEMGLKSDDSVQMDNEREIAATEIDESCFDELEPGKFVAAMYEDTWYIGKVEEIDRDDRDCLINFMRPAKAMFKWPNFTDKVWIREKDLICKINEPQKIGKSGRNFKITDEDRERISEGCKVSLKDNNPLKIIPPLPN